MYTLLHGLYKYLSQKDEYSVLILGLDNAGKTTYLEQAKTKFVKGYKSMPLNRITTTVGLNIGDIVVGGVKVKFWDLGGQEELQSLWDKYFSESHGIIFIVDSADSGRFDEARVALGRFSLFLALSYFRQEKLIENPTIEGVPLLLLANKQDLEAAFPIEEFNQVFYDILRVVGRRDCSVRKASALTGKGVTDEIAWIVNRMKMNAKSRPPQRQEIG